VAAVHEVLGSRASETHCPEYRLITLFAVPVLLINVISSSSL